MLGPDLQKFSGASERVKKLVDEIGLKLSVSAASRPTRLSRQGVQGPEMLDQPPSVDKWAVILGLMVVLMVTVCASYLAWAFLLEKPGELPTFPGMPDNESYDRNPLTQAVICHYGSNEETVVALPPDGVCDYTFCEQFYTPSHKGFLEGPTADQENFMMSASRHTMTEYGISFPILALGAVHRDLSVEAAASSVSRYWSMRFYHYGFVTMDLGRSFKELKHVLEILKMVKKLVIPLSRRQGRPSYTAIGWNEEDTSMVKEAAKMMKTTLMPDFIIVHGQRVYLGKNPTPDRVSAPTNMYVDNDTSSIVQTLGQAVNSLKELSRMRISAALSLSVSMSAYGYNLKNSDLPDGTGAMFQEANESSALPFTEYRHMCRLKRNNTKVPYSLAAYDLDWDDEEDTCSFANWFGAYSRVKMVRVLSEFFNYGFGTADDEADCLVIGDEF
ncbi:hypothetical protein HPB52_009641 [Rhipicephalus sanguineus]|uniref:Uncharacterized protein n=1 Tax=Rhipicephalus sanguineus TaxID=34632 RepID=A0A9D4PJV8_RHISA|nr:hypothetical protein HPB52_009641 [Rhipicephalus sanguineus]